MQRFLNRKQAGQLLADRLSTYKDKKEVLVLALPRGGVPIAFEVASALNLPLDVFLVRKLGVPGQEELAFGAIATENVCIFNDSIVSELHISQAMIQKIIEKEKEVIKKRSLLYRNGAESYAIKEQTVILIDDGIATGATMLAAIRAIKKIGCKKLIIAIPVAPSSTLAELAHEVDKIVCLIEPEPLCAIGYWYDDFTQTTDEEVIKLLALQAKSLKKSRY